MNPKNIRLLQIVRRRKKKIQFCFKFIYAFVLSVISNKFTNILIVYKCMKDSKNDCNVFMTAITEIKEKQNQ